MHNNQVKGIQAIGAASVQSDVTGYLDVACANICNAVDSATYLSGVHPGKTFRVFGPKGGAVAEFVDGIEV